MLSKNWNWAKAMPAKGKRMATEKCFILPSTVASVIASATIFNTCQSRA